MHYESCPNCSLVSNNFYSINNTVVCEHCVLDYLIKNELLQSFTETHYYINDSYIGNDQNVINNLDIMLKAIASIQKLQFTKIDKLWVLNNE